MENDGILQKAMRLVEPVEELMKMLWWG